MARKTAAIIRGDATRPDLVKAHQILIVCNAKIELIACCAGVEW
ncbi:MAG TPA: hypothetical protein VIP56_02070 [Nitrososphaeraceae archaeon]